MRFSTLAVFVAAFGSANGFAVNQANKPLAFATQVSFVMYDATVTRWNRIIMS